MLGFKIVMTQNMLRSGVMSDTQFSLADMSFVGNGHLFLNAIAQAFRVVYMSGSTPIASGMPQGLTDHTSNTKSAVVGPIVPGSLTDWLYHKKATTALYTQCVEIARQRCGKYRYVRFARRVFTEYRRAEAAKAPTLVWTDPSPWCGVDFF